MAASGAVDGARELLELVRCAGAIDVRPEASDAPEREAWIALPLRDRRRIVAANVDGVRLVARDGEKWDTACERWNAAHGTDLQVCEFVAVWAERALMALDARADERAGRVRDDLEARPEPELPAWFAGWADGLLCEAKRDYARALCWHLWAGEDAPDAPAGASWVDKVTRKVLNRFDAARERGEV